MSGPKHLWSGDWHDESEAAAQERAARLARTPAPQPSVADEPRPRRRPRARVWVALPVIVLLAAGAYGLTTLGSSKHPSSTFANQPPAQTAATPTSALARPVYWLGMELQTLPPGEAVIETVRQGSPSDLAGLSPGDSIVEINGRSIDNTSDIAAAIHGLHQGDRVSIETSSGFMTSATLAAPPSANP